MSHDDAVRDLAARAGFSVQWTDQAGESRTVTPETLRLLLSALGLACDSETETRGSLQRLSEIADAPAALVTATVGHTVAVPGKPGTAARLIREDGGTFDVILGDAGDGRALMRPVLETGYHRLETRDGAVTLAVAPRRGRSIVDAASGRRMWGLAAQVYGLTRRGDGGIGDLGG
ncbi:MAG TPA: 4-alpha-glucanotransferase, partial [Hansschlegelia sp.]